MRDDDDTRGGAARIFVGGALAICLVSACFDDEGANTIDATNITTAGGESTGAASSSAGTTVGASTVSSGASEGSTTSAVETSAATSSSSGASASSSGGDEVTTGVDAETTGVSASTTTSSESVGTTEEPFEEPYGPCERDQDCYLPGESCLSYAFQAYVCSPGCATDDDCPPADFGTMVLCAEPHCVVLCQTDFDCAPGMVCGTDVCYWPG